MSGMGAFIGLLLGLGVLATARRLPEVRAPRLLMRVAPFAPPLRHRAVPAPGPGRMLALLAVQSLPGVPRLHLGHDRLAVLAHGAIGSAIGLGLGGLAVVRGGSVIASLVLGLLGAVAGILVLDRRTAAARGRRREAVERELPVIVELMSLAVTAGESPIEAMARVSGMAAGACAEEMRIAVADIRAGLPFDEALRAMAMRSESADVQRFVDTVIVALDHGTPIAEVLRAQAVDAHAARRRRVMESAGRKDVAMLVPIVFLILPVVVAIGLFPGFRALQVLVP